MKIVFATNNAHKLDEIRHILGEKFEVLSLNDINCHDDIPETGTTLEENARQKAEYIYNKYHMNVFADDTGLEVEALGGEPGVYSARYAAIKNPTAESHDSEANMTTLLKNLEGTENRNARFRTVIAYIHRGRELLFDGIVNGSITTEKRGDKGFGYDPVFIPEGYNQTFAELGTDVKNSISHRARAVMALCEYLKQHHA